MPKRPRRSLAGVPKLPAAPRANCIILTMVDHDPRMEWVRRREERFAEIATNEALLRERVLQQLCGGLWHTTHPDRFKAILVSGAILPEPNIPDSGRWCTGGGSEHYPYARTLGGVSLFDFDQFDPDSYTERCPSSSWAYFVPYQSHWECAVWIEIDRGQVAPPHFISGVGLLAKWKSEAACGHNIMPEIEAAYLGPLSRVKFKRAFLVRKESSELLDVLNQSEVERLCPGADVKNQYG